MSADDVLTDVLVVAGETSGDLHAARLLTELGSLRPDMRFFGMGSGEMTAAGCECLVDSAEISVVGIVEVLKIYRRAKEIFNQLLAEVDRRQASVAVLIDFPEFNMRLARQLHERGVKVIYYISPQIWAWRQGRVKAIARDVDLMLVLFPFEVDFYRQHDVEVEWVGHPLVDEVAKREQAWDSAPTASAQQAVTVSLLPGSRKSEVRALLPAMLAAVELLAERRQLHVQLIQAPSISDSFLDELIAATRQSSGAGPKVELERIKSDRFAAIAASHLALCASGTATLEVGLLRTPMVVLYRLKWGSYWLGRLLVKLPHFCMVNLVLDKRAVPELIQGETRSDRVVAEMDRILEDRVARQQVRDDLAALRSALGTGGASRRAAAAVNRHLPRAGS